MDREELKNSIAAYYLGALAPEEAAAVAEQLRNADPEIQQLCAEMQAVVAALPFAVPEKQPDAQLKKKILAAVQNETQTVTPATVVAGPFERTQWLEKAKARWIQASWGFAFALLAVTIGLGWYSRGLQSRVDVLQNQLHINGQLVKALRTELSNRERIINLVGSPGVQIVDLNGLAVSPAADGRVYWDAAGNEAVLAVSNLPAPPTDKDYQLWMLRGNQPVDAGVFAVDSTGTSVLQFATIADGENLAAFAVTLEPKGGVPQPTGQMYLLGAISGG